MRNKRRIYGQVDPESGLSYATETPSPELAPLLNVPNADLSQEIPNLTHPSYNTTYGEWEKWRLSYEGGEAFKEAYLTKYSHRETAFDFNRRKRVTPIPAFAKAAINDIKNAIFQRMIDVVRSGGPTTYSQSCKGEIGGVDLNSGTMNWFIGDKILPELLTMKRVGVFIDAPPNLGPTIATKGNQHPYIYIYKTENIRNWARNQKGEFTSVLLRDYNYTFDKRTGLPTGRALQYRLLQLNNLGSVTVSLFNDEGERVDTQILNLPKIPFVVFEITESLMAGVANHQIALLNLESSDIGYCLLANHPFYIEQADANNMGMLMKRLAPTANPADPNCPLPINDSGEDDIDVGVSHGRRYGRGLNPPDFIHPSPEPLKASIEKQDKLKEDIRLLVNLSLANVKATQASAESKAMDQAGLESGLSAIGLELEHGERQIAEIWTLYEDKTSDTPQVRYPQRYSLKSDKERLDEAEQFDDILLNVPSRKFGITIQKRIIEMIVADRVSPEELQAMYREVELSPAVSANPKQIAQDVKDRLLSRASASKARSYPETEIELADKEDEARLKRIQATQAKALPLKNAAARGLPEADPNPNSGQTEKIGKPKRGAGNG